MILKATYDYLTDPIDAVAFADVPFRYPAEFAGLIVTSRNDARRELRSRVGLEIYAARRPQKSSQHSAVTLRLISCNRELETVGEHDLAEAFVQVDCWARGGDAAQRSEVIATLVRLATVGSHSCTWGQVKILGVSIARESQQVQLSDQGSSVWDFSSSIDLRIHFAQASASF